jgi:preprotein translocase subunit SecG
MLLGTGFSAYAIPEASYQLDWKTAKYFDTQAFFYVWYAVIAFAAGGILVESVLPRTHYLGAQAVIEHLRLPWRALRVLFYLSFVTILVAYAIWLVVLVQHGVSPGDLVAALRGDAGANYQIRGSGETLPGVTTFTQLAAGFFILGTILISKFGWRGSFFTLILPMLFIFFLTVIRSKLWSERIAVLEILIPLVILGARFVSWGKSKRWTRGCVAVAPVAAVLLLFIFFSVAEYSRSWLGVYSQSQDSFLLFSFTRLVGYYVTSLNNGALSVQVLNHYDFPYYTLAWFWRFPIIDTLVPYGNFGHASPDDDYNDLLLRFGNPEFTNPSGVFLVRLDYGFTGGIFAWFAFGVIAMLLYRSFRKGSLIGLLLYPFFYIGLLESPRIFYWSEPRSLPTWGLLFLILAVALFTSQTLKPGRSIREGIVRRPRLPQNAASPQPNSA